jgi:hypothetical protein
MPSLAQIQELNEAFFDSLSTPGMEKVASDAIHEFTRTTVREDGILRRMIPAVQVSNSDLTRQIDTDKNCIIVDKEPGSPAAVSMPYGTLPIRWYIRGDRYAVTFDRKMTPMFQKDLAELRTYKMDIRQIISDKSLKDLLYEEDRCFVAAIKAALFAQDTNVPYSGVPQWQTVTGGIDRDTWQYALSIMPSTPSHLEANTILMNNITIREFMKWGRDELGGDTAEKLVFDGWADRKLDGKDVLVTIKRGLVPDNEVCFMADPRFVGKLFLCEDVVLHVERRLFMIEFCAWEEIGGAIGHTGGIAWAQFV